jgi:2-dehydro-3-deoxyphosphogluconate aldolase/(4S)-4-hydroxy-2-oxoglutarate aldolase
MDKHAAVEAVMRAAPVIPVVVIDDPHLAVDMAHALVAGGIPAIEITLRTPRAMECLAQVARQVHGAIPGAGTVLSAAQMRESVEAGAKFLVSPGASPKLLDAADDTAVPLLPGVATPGEMMSLAERGYRHMKFFPAMQAGGPSYLKAVSSPLAHLRFCPTGGVTPQTAREFLALDNVLCVGGSWLAPADALKARDWSRITELAREAAAMARTAA